MVQGRAKLKKLEQALVKQAALFIEAMAPRDKRKKADEATARKIAEDITRKLSFDGPPAAKDERVEAAEKVAALGDAWKPGEVVKALAPFAPEPEPRVRDIGDFWDLPEPEPILWRDPQDDESEDGPVDAVLSVGEVAVVSGAGGLGKSMAAVQLAMTAAGVGRHEYGAACGLRVRGGGAVVVSYEDPPVRIAHRLKRMGWRPGEGSLRVVDPLKPLFPVGACAERPRDHGKAENWKRLWAELRGAESSLVVIDTGPKCMGGLADYSPGPVIAFLDALKEEAIRGDLGILVVAHDTKAARGGGDAGAGGVAGSGQWIDTPRGVLHMWRDPDVPKDLWMLALKANYGRERWGMRLRHKLDEKVHRGVKCVQRLDVEEMRLFLENGTGKGNGTRDEESFDAQKRDDGHEVFKPGEIAR